MAVEADHLRRLRADPVRTMREIGMTDDDFGRMAKLFYLEWRKTNAEPAATRPAPPAPKTPENFIDENGVTVLFNDHKWFCFEIEKAKVTMCAVSPAECVEFAEALNSRPTCGIREAATCVTYEKDGKKGGKCFATSGECQMFYKAFIDDQTKITSSCITLRYRGY